MRHPVARVLAALPLFLYPLAATAQQPAAAPAHQLIDARCTRCHSNARVLTADPDQLKSIVERMALKSPEAFRDADRGDLVASLAGVLNDPAIVARKKAWDETVAKGMAVFADPALGTTGKSCSSCHQPEQLRGVADRYPEYDAKLGRLVDLQERLRLMIATKLGGKQLPLGDMKTVALEVYLKSLQ